MNGEVIGIVSRILSGDFEGGWRSACCSCQGITVNVLRSGKVVRLAAVRRR